MATHTRTATHTNARQVRTLSKFSLLLGIWLVISPFALALTSSAIWNNVICGAAVFVLAVVRLSRPPGTRAASMLNALLGIWLVFAPFVLDFAAGEAVWNNMLAGMLVLMLALSSAAQMANHSGRVRGRAADARTTSHTTVRWATSADADMAAAHDAVAEAGARTVPVESRSPRAGGRRATR